MLFRSLELMNTCFVSITGLFTGDFFVESGTPLNEVGNLSFYLNHEELCVGDGDSQPRIAFKLTQVVSRNMNVIVEKCMKVTVGAPVNKNERMIAGETLAQLALFFDFSFDNFIVVANKRQQVLNKSSMIESDTLLKLCHKVTTTGVINTTVLVESGTQQLGGTVLSVFFKVENYYEVRDASGSSRYYGSSDTISHDINVTITDKCGSFEKQRCLDTGNVCKWNNNGFCSRDVANAPIQVIVISFDDIVDVSADDIKQSITDIVGLPDESLLIEVVEQEDGSFVVSVVQTNEVRTDVGGMLTECMSLDS